MSSPSKSTDEEVSAIEEQAEASAENEVVPDKLKPKVNRKVVISAVVVAACAGILAGVLASKPWEKANGDEQQASSNTAAADGTPSSLVVPWPHDESDIPPDPAVTYGTLDNGLRYMIMKNSEPPNKLMLRMHIDAGSYHEDEDQRGVAHFLEHMAFNGLRNFEADELIPQMQRLGIAFGAHANAYTTFDETVYMLDLPDSTSDDVLDLGFKVMRDYADGILFQPEEIEKERGVVLSEKAARDSVDRRLMEQLYEFLLPDHRLPARWPIGTKEVISTAPRQRFVDFYQEFYVPERTTFIACGDANPEEMKARIVDAYESMASDSEERNKEDVFDMGSAPTGTGFRTAVFADEEVVSDQLFLTFVKPYDEPLVDTESRRIDRLPLKLAHSILSRRLDIAAKKEGSPFRNGNAYRDSWFAKSGVNSGTISVIPVSGGDNWKASISALEQEFRRVIEHGFAPFELDEAKANLLSSYKRRVDASSTRKSQSLANQLINTINYKRVFSTPEKDLQIIEKGIESISPENAHEAFKSFWDTLDLNLILYTNAATSDTADEMEQIYAESKEVEVTPPDMEFDATFQYTDFGPPGEITSDSTQDDLDIRQLVLSNNVRVNLKKTDFEANNIILSAHFGTGVLGQDPTKSGIQWLAPIMFNDGGLGKHSKDDLGRILAGKNVGVGLSILEGGFVLSGATTPGDLELQMQLMTASMTDPGFRPEALQSWKQIIPSYVTYLANTFNGALNEVTSFLKGGDGRFRVPSSDDMEALTISDVEDWLKPQLAESYLELSMVGDFDMDTAIPLILKTFGALPARQDAPPVVGSELRSINFPETPSENTFTYESKIPHAAAMVVFKGPSLGEDVSLARRLNILSSILKDRMRIQIREDLGESYGPRAYAESSEAFDYGSITALSQGSPEFSEFVSHHIVAIAKNVTVDISEDELVRAKEPKLNSLEQTLRRNSYWLNTVMRESQAKPWKLDWSRERDEDYASIHLDEIKQLAAKYLAPDNLIRMEILPTTPEDEQ